MSNSDIDGLLHDLGTPLNILLNLFPELENEMKEQNVDAKLEQIRQTIECMVVICNIYKAPKVEDNLLNVVQKVTKMLEYSAKPKGISLCVEKKSQAPMQAYRLSATVNGPVTQALMNLIQNSIKFMEDSEPVKMVIVRFIDSQKVIEITDTGTGIPPEERSKLFVFGERLKSGKPGSGIGLANCKKILEKVNCDLTVSAGPDTVFVISLPKSIKVV